MSNFDAALEFVLKWEGGYVNDPDDPGGETRYGISKRAYPHLDIANLNRSAARAIYLRDYWQVSGCDDLPAAAAVAVFDFAVNAGPERAKRFWRDTGNVYAFTAERIRFYTKLASLFPKFGRGWMNRVADLMVFVLALPQERLGEFDTVVLHDFENEKDIYRGSFLATRTGKKLELRRQV